MGKTVSAVEWLEKELKELGLSKREGSLLIGKSHQWISVKCRSGLDMWDAIAIAADINRAVRKMEPKNCYAKWTKAKKEAKKRKRQQRQMSCEWPEMFWE